jgi:hypothetical protein
MAVREVLHALGSFDFKLKGTTPRDVLDAIQYFGHIAILPGRVYIEEAGDNSLTAARYVGVVRKKKIGDDARTSEVGDDLQIGGVGIAFWLGDDDSDRGKGDVIEVPATFTNETFANTVRGLLPDAVVENTIYSVSGGFSGQFVYETPRTAIQYVCDTFSASTGLPVSWRVNGDASLDAGPESDLYVTNPTCVVVRRGFGEDMSMRALEGSMDVEEDMEDFSTRVVLLAEGEGTTIATGSADISGGLNPYKDLHGNSLKLTRIASESDTSTGNAEARAQLQLNRFSSSRKALSLSADDYDVHGSFNVGDYIYVYDPDAGLVDTNHEIEFRGERLNPIKLQVHETSWSITSGYSVGYRDRAGNWYDLTDYIDFETLSSSKITVGDFSRTLSVSSGESVGTRPNADTSTPDTPTWLEPFQTLNYQDDLGFTRSRVRLSWSAPNNTDGSTVLDGDHYEIQVRVDTDAIYPQSWSSVSSTSWQDANSWAQPFTPSLSAWETKYVAWGETVYDLNDLATGVGYDVRIRGVDTAGNIGEWEETTFVTTQDNVAPSTPAAPSVAGSRIALQVTHELGRATGGTFNLEADLHHLEIHVDYEPHFTPSDTTLKGTVIANQGMIAAQIPAVVTVQVEETSTRYVRVIAVDRAGNKSLASDAASADALLIDDAHISDLTVSKLTAGTISADFILGARIKTANDGARVEMNQNGIEAYNSAGQQTVDIGTDGNVSMIGTFSSGPEGSSKRVVLNPGNTGLPEIRFYSNDGTEYGGINGATSSGDDDQEVAMGMFSSNWTGDADIERQSRIRLYKGGGSFEVVTDEQQAYGGFHLITDTYARSGYRDAVQTYGTVYVDVDTAIVEIVDSGTALALGSTEASIFYKRATADEQGFIFGNTTTHYGSWNDFVSASSTQGIFTGTVDASSGSSSLGLTYGPTMASQMIPIVSIRDDIAHSFNISDATAIGFSTEISPAGSGVWALYFWCWRLG